MAHDLADEGDHSLLLVLLHRRVDLPAPQRHRQLLLPVLLRLLLSCSLLGRPPRRHLLRSLVKGPPLLVGETGLRRLGSLDALPRSLQPLRRQLARLALLLLKLTLLEPLALLALRRLPLHLCLLLEEERLGLGLPGAQELLALLLALARLALRPLRRHRVDPRLVLLARLLLAHLSLVIQLELPLLFRQRLGVASPLLELDALTALRLHLRLLRHPHLTLALLLVAYLRLALLQLKLERLRHLRLPPLGEHLQAPLGGGRLGGTGTGVLRAASRRRVRIGPAAAAGRASLFQLRVLELELLGELVPPTLEVLNAEVDDLTGLALFGHEARAWPRLQVLSRDACSYFTE